VRLGPRGLGYTIGITGRRVTAGLPGTVLSVTHKFADWRAADHAPVLDVISLLALIAWLFLKDRRVIRRARRAWCP
jgi:hypothetical protein